MAKHANCSIATVSRVINNQGGYSEKTKKKILDVIEELGYQPNAVARGLINKRTQTIGVLVPDLSSMLSSEILSGIESVAHKENLSVFISHTNTHGKRTSKYLKLLNEKRIDGLIFTSEYLKDEYLKEMKKMDIPIVLVSTESFKDSIPYVKVDDRRAAYSATNYLIENGHQDIVMISGPYADPIAGRPRVEGFKEALDEHSIPVDEANIFCTDGFLFEDGKKAFEELFNQNLNATAIFAASDELAVGVISAAYERGLTVPDDFSIIGYDNTKTAIMSNPPLTTVSQPLFRMGQTSCEMLLQMLKDEATVESRIMVHEIIERKTVKKI